MGGAADGGRRPLAAKAPIRETRTTSRLHPASAQGRSAQERACVSVTWAAASWIGLVRPFRQQFAASEQIQTEDVERAPHLLALREKQSSRGSGSIAM